MAGDTRTDDRDFDALLEAIYEGPLETAPWKSLLPLLRTSMDSLAATLILRPPTPEDPGLLLSYPDADEYERSYQEGYFSLDPFVDLPLGEVMTLEDLVPNEELVKSEFYKQYMEPSGAFHVLGFDTREPDGLEARIRISRGRDDPAFGDTERALCERLVPHFRRAVQLHARLTRTESERDLFAGAVDRLSMGVIVLDERGKVLRMNRVATLLIEGKRGLAVVNGRLRAATADQSVELRRVVERALTNRAGGVPSVVQGMRLRESPGGGAVNLVARPVPLAEWSEGKACPAVAIFVGDPDDRPEVSLEIVRQLFGFTPAEALLATTLARGLNLDEAASALGTSRNTARSHLRAIFSKTGVTRQADLVRLILRSVASLG
jgi:DNA-binding CsgD family transcriptional regulator